LYSPTTTHPLEMPSRSTAKVELTSAERRHRPRARSAMVTPLGATAERDTASQMAVTRLAPAA
jgi:hypothetical protein